MLETALTLKQVSTHAKLTYKTIVAAGLVALAVILPQLIHLALGAPGGVKWLPMYLPVLVGGCLLGAKWGVAVGVLSPLVSFVLTDLLGNPMPPAARLPFMVAELAVFAIVSGLFTKKIVQNGWWAFPAVLLAQVVGRAAFLGLIALTQSVTEFTVPMIWAQIQAGWMGVLVQAILVPVVILILRAVMLQEKENE